MRGIGGPLLCIGDLLSDVGEENDLQVQPPVPQQQITELNSNFTPEDATKLPQLFQEHYGKLNEALAGSDPSWTALTLKLCTAVETANKLIQSTNSNVGLLSKKVQQLEAIIKRGDSTVAAARAINTALSQKEGPSSLSKNNQETGSTF